MATRSTIPTGRVQIGVLIVSFAFGTYLAADERGRTYLDYLYSRSGRGSVSSAPTIRNSPIPRAPRRRDRVHEGVPRASDNYRYGQPYGAASPRRAERVYVAPPPPEPYQPPAEEVYEPAPTPAPPPPQQVEEQRPPPSYPSAYRGTEASNVLRSPPAGYEEVSIRGKKYYRQGTRFYKPCYYSGTVCYQEVDPPIGAAVSALPDGHTKVIEGESTYYRYRGSYYEAFTAADGDQQFRVVDRPATSPGTGAPDDPYTIFQKMVDFLLGVQICSVDVSDTSDYRLSSGQRAQISTVSSFDIQHPDKARFSFKGKDIDRTSWYDGKTISILEKDQKVYAVIPMPNTIRAMVDTLTNDYGIVFPMVELVRGHAYNALTTKATKVLYIGKTQLNGAECHHLFFDTSSLSLQIWIATGNTPLPLQVLITYKEADGPMRFLGTYKNWNLSPEFLEGHFTFKPPKDAEEVEAVERGKLRK